MDCKLHDGYTGRNGGFNQTPEKRDASLNKATKGRQEHPAAG